MESTGHSLVLLDEVSRHFLQVPPFSFVCSSHVLLRLLYPSGHFSPSFSLCHLESFGNINFWPWVASRIFCQTNRWDPSYKGTPRLWWINALRENVIAMRVSLSLKIIEWARSATGCEESNEVSRLALESFAPGISFWGKFQVFFSHTVLDSGRRRNRSNRRCSTGDGITWIFCPKWSRRFFSDNGNYTSWGTQNSQI